MSTEIESTSPGGQGEILADPHREQSDINLIRRAVRERWPVPAAMKVEVVERLRTIVAKTEVQVMTKEGLAMLDGPADSNANAAARVLVAMDGLNQADDHLADKNKRMDEGKPTERVAVEPVVLERPINPNLK
jgi:hypothetical protein